MVDVTPHKVFLKFFRGDLSTVPTVFSSCAHIYSLDAFGHKFEIIGYYGYDM